MVLGARSLRSGRPHGQVLVRTIFLVVESSHRPFLSACVHKEGSPVSLPHLMRALISSWELHPDDLI